MNYITMSSAFHAGHPSRVEADNVARYLRSAFLVGGVLYAPDGSGRVIAREDMLAFARHLGLAVDVEASRRAEEEQLAAAIAADIEAAALHARNQREEQLGALWAEIQDQSKATEAAWARAANTCEPGDLAHAGRQAAKLQQLRDDYNAIETAGRN